MARILNIASVIVGIAFAIFAVYSVQNSNEGTIISSIVLGFFSFIAGYIFTILMFYFALTLLVIASFIIVGALVLSVFVTLIGILSQLLSFVT